MNIIIKSFDGSPDDKQVLEIAFKYMKLGTCICIMDDEKCLPDVDATELTWISADDQRKGIYSDVDWNEITPLDEEIIEEMQHCEAVFLDMVGRYATYRDMSYSERRRQYLNHLRYWNHILISKKIDFLLMYNVPHQCYDFVLYNLCKLKDIPICYMERLNIVDALFFVDEWENSGVEVQDTLKRLEEEYKDPNKPIPLSDSYEYYLQIFTKRKPETWYIGYMNDRITKDPKFSSRHNFFRRWAPKVFVVLKKNPVYFFKSIISSEFWSRKLRQHKLMALYEKNTQIPDFSKPYIYAPLHYQPEATTCPLAGAYTDQELGLQLLAACLPPEIDIYVKEHPMQQELGRSEDAYKSLLKIPSIKFIPKSTNSFQLIDNSIAVISATGTSLFEAFVHLKPAIMLGHYIYQYANGIYPVRTLEDCKKAVHSIVKGQKKHTLRDVRLFLKAIEECGTPFASYINSPFYKHSREDKIKLVGEKLREYVSDSAKNID